MISLMHQVLHPSIDGRGRNKRDFPYIGLLDFSKQRPIAFLHRTMCPPLYASSNYAVGVFGR